MQGKKQKSSSTDTNGYEKPASSVATGLFKFSPDFVSKKKTKTQVLKTTFKAPKLRDTSLLASTRPAAD